MQGKQLFQICFGIPYQYMSSKKGKSLLLGSEFFPFEVDLISEILNEQET